MWLWSDKVLHRGYHLIQAHCREHILRKSDMNLGETDKAMEGKECGKEAKMNVWAQDTKVSLVKTDIILTHLSRRCTAEIATRLDMGQAQ